MLNHRYRVANRNQVLYGWEAERTKWTSDLLPANERDNTPPLRPSQPLYPRMVGSPTPPIAWLTPAPVGRSSLSPASLPANEILLDLKIGRRTDTGPDAAIRARATVPAAVPAAAAAAFAAAVDSDAADGTRHGSPPAVSAFAPLPPPPGASRGHHDSGSAAGTARPAAAGLDIERETEAPGLLANHDERGC